MKRNTNGPKTSWFGSLGVIILGPWMAGCETPPPIHPTPPPPPAVAVYEPAPSQAVLPPAASAPVAPVGAQVSPPVPAYVATVDPAPAPQPVSAYAALATEEDAAGMSYFHDTLAPYGRWVWSLPYGWVWTPSGMAAEWRPYTVGRWVYTDDFGWTWVSGHEWGWAPFHFGRWDHVPAHGWVWIPGSVWGPAWVTWRVGGGYCGWAPLPPALGGAVVIGPPGVSIPSSWWCFVNEKEIVAVNVHRHLAPVARNVSIVNVTMNVTDIRIVDRRVVNRSLDPAIVVRATGRPIERYRIEDRSAPAEGRGVITPGRVALYRPSVGRSPAEGGRMGSATAVDSRAATQPAAPSAPAAGSATVVRTQTPAMGGVAPASGASLAIPRISVAQGARGLTVPQVQSPSVPEVKSLALTPARAPAAARTQATTTARSVPTTPRAATATPRSTPAPQTANSGTPRVATGAAPTGPANARTARAAPAPRTSGMPVARTPEAPRFEAPAASRSQAKTTARSVPATPRAATATPRSTPAPQTAHAGTPRVATGAAPAGPANARASGMPVVRKR